MGGLPKVTENLYSGSHACVAPLFLTTRTAVGITTIPRGQHWTDIVGRRTFSERDTICLHPKLRCDTFLGVAQMRGVNVRTSVSVKDLRVTRVHPNGCQVEVQMGDGSLRRWWVPRGADATRTVIAALHREALGVLGHRVEGPLPNGWPEGVDRDLSEAPTERFDDMEHDLSAAPTRLADPLWSLV